MLSIDEASQILLKVLSPPSVEIAENILRDAIRRDEIGCDETRTTLVGSNEIFITLGITPGTASASDETDFSEFSDRWKRLLELAVVATQSFQPKRIR